MESGKAFNMKKSNIHIDSIAIATELAKEIKKNACKENPMQSIGKMLFSFEKIDKIYFNEDFEIDEEFFSKDRATALAQAFMNEMCDQPKTKAFVFVAESYAKLFEENLPDASQFGKIQKEYLTDCTSNTFRVINVNSLNAVSGKQASFYVPYTYNDKGFPSFENIPEKFLCPKIDECEEETIDCSSICVAFKCCFEELKNPGTYFK